MLWLCIYLPHWPLEALTPPEDRPTAIVATIKNRRYVIACNAAAKAAGVGTTALTTALAVHSTLSVLERNAKAELTALKRLAAWAYQWSSQVTWREAQSELGDYAPTLWLEIGASRVLFGGYELLLTQLEASLQTLGYTYRLGIAPTLEGALALARAGIRRLLVAQERLIATLRPLPLDCLALTAEIRYALRRAGITHIAALLDLPGAGIARRFGPQVALYLQRLCGTAPDPRIFYRLPKRYRARCDFGFAVRHAEALLFPLQRMLHEFCGYLRAADIATQRFAIVLEHERQAVTRIAIGLMQPNRDAARLLALAKEKFHNFVLGGDVHGLRIEANHFTAPAIRQQSLIAGESEITDELHQVLETLTARLGNAVHLLQPQADHRPEYAWRFATSAQATTPLPGAARPLWLLQSPRRLSTPPAASLQAERIASGWWSEHIERDYYIAQSAKGEQCWVYQDRRDGAWYLHGYWS